MCQKPLQNHSVFRPPVASSEYETFLANTVIKQVYDSQKARCFTPDTWLNMDVLQYRDSQRNLFRLTAGPCLPLSAEWLYCTICDVLCLFFALSLSGCPCHIAFTVIANGNGDTSLYIRDRHVSQKKNHPNAHMDVKGDKQRREAQSSLAVALLLKQRMCSVY